MKLSARGMRTDAIILVAAVAWMAGACGSSPAPTAGAPATPAATLSTAGPVDPTPVIDPTPVGGSAQPEAVITAQNIEFQPGKIGVQAGVPFTLVLDNRDTSIPHNVQIVDAMGNAVFTGEIVTGPTRLSMALPALAPGEYPFTCTVHPNMTGVIVAQP